MGIRPVADFETLNYQIMTDLNTSSEATITDETAIGFIPCYNQPFVTLYNTDCLNLIDSMPIADCVITDPPYPNNAGHFIDGIKDAVYFMQNYKCKHWFIFWDEMTKPPIDLPLVAIHIWHRSNTNRPDNYEPIYEFNENGIKRASRVIPAPVIYPGLTGCIEATGHPTQKPVKLIRKLITYNKITGLVADPFFGSGTVAEACLKEKINFIGSEKDSKHYQDAVNRLERMRMSPTLF